MTNFLHLLYRIKRQREFIHMGKVYAKWTYFSKLYINGLILDSYGDRGIVFVSLDSTNFPRNAEDAAKCSGLC